MNASDDDVQRLMFASLSYTSPGLANAVSREPREFEGVKGLAWWSNWTNSAMESGRGANARSLAAMSTSGDDSASLPAAAFG